MMRNQRTTNQRYPPSDGEFVSNRATAATSLKEIMIDDGQPEDDEHIQAELGPHRGRRERRPNNHVHGPEWE